MKLARILLFLCITISFTRCNLNKLEMKDFEGRYVSNTLQYDTLFIVKFNDKLYWYRKHYNEYGDVILQEHKIMRFDHWRYHGESEKESLTSIGFSATYEIEGDTIYIYQIDANADIIEDHYYKKVSNDISNEIRDKIEKNKDEVEEISSNIINE